MIHLDSLPRALGLTLGRGDIKSIADDFIVREHLGFVPSGQGEHVWLRVEKRLANTDWVAGVLAKHAGIRKRDVGYSGKKDKYALTQQWFSFTMPGKPEVAWHEIEALYDGRIAILQVARHIRKLKRGWHKSNVFKITVRGLKVDRLELSNRLNELRRSGFPNYFMQQRFGNNEENLKKIDDIISGKIKFKRHQHGILLSSARAFLFNQSLAARINAQHWGELFVGDVVKFANNRSMFLVDALDESLVQRHQGLDLHVTAPLWGNGPLTTTEHVLASECEMMRRYPDLCGFMQQAGLTMDRRAIRAVPKKLGWQYANEQLILVFALPSGAYATALMRELIDTHTAVIPREFNSPERRKV